MTHTHVTIFLENCVRALEFDNSHIMISFFAANQLHCLVKCIIFLALCQKISTNNITCVAPIKDPDIQIGKKLPISTFLVLNKIGFQSCFKECEAYANCLSVNFNRIHYTCGLNEFKESELHALVDAGDIIYREIPDLVSPGLHNLFSNFKNWNDLKIEITVTVDFFNTYNNCRFFYLYLHL